MSMQDLFVYIHRSRLCTLGRQTLSPSGHPAERTRRRMRMQRVQRMQWVSFPERVKSADL